MGEHEKQQEIPEAKKAEYAELRGDLEAKKQQSLNLPDEFLQAYEKENPHDYAALKEALASEDLEPDMRLEAALMQLEAEQGKWSREKAFEITAQALSPVAETFLQQILTKDVALYTTLREQFTQALVSGDQVKLTSAFQAINEGFAKTATLPVLPTASTAPRLGFGDLHVMEAQKAAEAQFAQVEPVLRSLFGVNKAFLEHFQPEQAAELQKEYDAALASKKIEEIQKVLAHSNEVMLSTAREHKENASALYLRALGVADALRDNAQADYPDEFLRSLQKTAEGSALLKTFAELTDLQNVEPETTALLAEMDMARKAWEANPGDPEEVKEPLDPLMIPFNQLEKAYRPGAEHLLQMLTSKDAEEGAVFRAQYEEALRSRDNEFLIQTYDVINDYAKSQGLAGVPAPTFTEFEGVSPEQFGQFVEGYRSFVEQALPVITERNAEKGAALKANYEAAVASGDFETLVNAYVAIVTVFANPDAAVPEVTDASTSDSTAEQSESEQDFVRKLKEKPEEYVTKTEEGDKTTLDLKVPDQGSRIQHIVGPEGSGAVVSLPEADLGQTVLTDSQGTEYAWDGNTWTHEGRRLLVGPSYETKVVMRKKTADNTATDVAPAAAGDAKPQDTVPSTAPAAAAPNPTAEAASSKAPESSADPFDSWTDAKTLETIGEKFTGNAKLKFRTGESSYLLDGTFADGKFVSGKMTRASREFSGVSENYVLKAGHTFTPADGLMTSTDILPHFELVKDKKREATSALTLSPGETPEEYKLRVQTRELLDQVYAEGKEAKLAPKIDAALKGKRYKGFSFNVNDDYTLTATLELTDATGKIYKYSDTSVAHVAPEGYVYKKIAFPFDAAPDRFKEMRPAPQVIELNMSRRQSLKGMLKNLAEGKTVA